jgi:hypothetical protein
VEPEKQTLLANGSETTFGSRQRLGKHVPAATDTHATIGVLWKRCFLLGPCKGVIRKTAGATQSICRVEAESNTSTVALRVAGGDEKGTQCLRV